MPHTSMWSIRCSLSTSSRLWPRASTPSNAEYAASFRPLLTMAWMYFSRTRFWIAGTKAAPGVPMTQWGGHELTKSGGLPKCSFGSSWKSREATTNWYSYLKCRICRAIMDATSSPFGTARLPPCTKSPWTSTTSSAFLISALLASLLGGNYTAFMASVIVAGARTPFGKFGGAFKEVPATSLGARAIRAAVERSGIQPEDVDYVIMGQVLQAGAGQITARQAAIEAGIPQEVPAITINKVCLSGLNAIALADQLIRAGEVEVVVAGGMESMSEAPYLFPKARFGARMGNTELVDSMVHDGLWSTFTEKHMGESSDDVNRELEDR